MPYYVMLSQLTDEGAKTLKNNPRRITEVDAELEALGVKVLEQYATLGSYDFVNIVEAPDDMTVARASLELSSRGSIRLTTLPALPVTQLIEALGPAGPGTAHVL